MQNGAAQSLSPLVVGATQSARQTPTDAEALHWGRAGANVPLVVDLDGTLISSDLLLESALMLAKKRPLAMLKMLFWLARGRAYLKRRIASETCPDAQTLPYNRALVDYLEAEKSSGRRLVLATGSDEAIARNVASELKLFDSILASDGNTNLTGARKRDRLVAEFGVKGFDYAGDSRRDRPVWAAARKAIVVGPNARLFGAKQLGCELDRTYESKAPGLPVLFQAMRVKHWFKNLLVFVPLLASHQLYDRASLLHSLAAFVAFCLCASGVYLLNDLLDLPHDRLHPHKKKRMLASGQLNLGRAIVFMPLLWVGAAAICLTQPHALLVALTVYCALMLAYCFKLRDNVVVDVVVLAAGYALRVIAGSAATGLPVATPVLAACILFFFGLALLKRYAELVTMRLMAGGNARARGYIAQHSIPVAIFGCLSSCLAVAVLAHHAALERPLFSRYGLIWIIFPLLLLWVGHLWRMARCGRIPGDPVTYALSDPLSRFVAVPVATLLLLST
jgi:4-hydroxybenzoate polyprenyltransferase/phosphoserine phosphatase